MISQITSALTQGFTAKQILDFLIKQFPGQSKKIKEALSLGYSAENVLKYLSGGRKELANAEMGTAQARTRQRDIENRENVTQSALKGAGIAGLGTAAVLGAPMAAQALQRASPMAMQALQRAAPQLLGPGAVTQTPLTAQPQAPQGQALAPSAGTTSSQPPINAPTIPQPQAPLQPEVKTIDTAEILNKHGLSRHVDELAAKRKDPNAIAAILYNKFPKEMQAFQKDIGKKMEEGIADYLQKSTSEAQTSPKIPTSTSEIPKPTELVEEPKKIGDKFIDRKGEEATITQINDKTFEFKTPSRTRSGPISSLKNEISQKKPLTEKVKISKNETVSSPQGIGEVKEIRNGKALVEVDGKLHKVNEDELIESPLPEKDLADLHDEYMRGIEQETGEDISRMVNWAGYNPKTNTLAFLPHVGALYTYKKISPQQAELLTNVLTTRKTSGENFIGAWKAGSKSPIGAAMSALIKELQKERGGKGNEYEEKFETLYDALEAGKLAAKKKKKKKK